ncbi:hypothetical protein H0N99_00065 [Candidatus Micrarchaeota archaeon]|nr:hypothetical protein [Candidatus Micrarchaeota archaeon]
MEKERIEQMNIIKILACVLLAAIFIYIALSLFVKKDYRIGELAMRGKYEHLLANDALRRDWEKLVCTVDINNSLAQSLHIVREGGVASCIEERKGELYDKFGKPFSCNADDAGRIDAAVRKSGSCIFPLGSPLNENVSDYHAFVLMCVVNLTNWNYTRSGPCDIGYPQSVIYAVVDADGNVFY